MGDSETLEGSACAVYTYIHACIYTAPYTDMFKQNQNNISFI